MFTLGKNRLLKTAAKVTRSYVRNWSAANEAARLEAANRFYFIYVPKIGVTVGLVALCFQVGVLYPW